MPINPDTQIDKSVTPKNTAKGTDPEVGSGEGAFYYKQVSGRTELFSKNDQGQLVQITENGEIKGVGTSGVVSVNSLQGAVVLNTSNVPVSGDNKYITQAEKNSISSNSAHAGSPHAPATAEKNPNQVTSLEKTSGTETALRSFSPKDVADMANVHGGGITSASILLPQTGGTLNSRLAGATVNGVAVGSSGWTLNTADQAGDANLGSDVDSLVVTWPTGEGDRVAQFFVFQKSSSGPTSVQGWSPIDMTTSSDQKTNLDGTSGAAHLGSKGIQVDRDLKLLITLI